MSVYSKASYQNGLGLDTLPFWLFLMAMIPVSVLMTWIYNNNQRSPLSAVLFHFMINFVGGLIAVTKRAEFYQVLLLTAVAATVAIIRGSETLTRGQKSPHPAEKVTLA